MANDKISNYTAAVVGDLTAANTGLDVTIDLAGSPLTRRLTLGVLADWLEASQLETLIVTGRMSSVTALATPAALVATTAHLFASTASGGVLMGFGTTGDVTLKNRAGTDVLYCGPNTTLITIPGTLTVTGTITSGNQVLLSTATAAIGFKGSVGVYSTINASGSDVLQFRPADSVTTLSLSTAGATVTGTHTVTGAFGCNTKAAQTAYVSGGALAAYGAGANGLDSGANMSALHALVVNIRAALVADGIMS